MARRQALPSVPESVSAPGGPTIFTVLRRLVPLARRLLWGVRVLAIASAVSIAVMVAVLVGHGMPDLLSGGFLVVAVALLAPAPVVLWMFHGALREVLALPEWLQSSPEVAKGHASELAGLVTDARRSGRRRGSFLGDSMRAGRLLLQAHDDLPGYGAILRLVSPLFLIVVAIALFAASFEIALASLLLAVDLAVRVIG